MHAKVFSIKIFQYLRQIPPRVCTSVLFIIISGSGIYSYNFENVSLGNLAIVI